MQFEEILITESMEIQKNSGKMNSYIKRLY